MIKKYLKQFLVYEMNLRLCFCLIAISTLSISLAQAQSQVKVQHVKVYGEEGKFAAWPANNGIWVWGNEILVGFVKANHKNGSGHTYERTTARDIYARSKDGGLTWTVEDAYEKGQTAYNYNNELGALAKKPVGLQEPIHFTNPNLALTLKRETNTVGPSYFYYSYDRGNSWKGAFKLPDLGTPGFASRTDYIVKSDKELLAMVTVGKSNGKEGRVACIRTADGGLSWKFLSYLGDKEPENFEVMPSSRQLDGNKILSIVRKRDAKNQDLLISYSSTDGGNSWIDNGVVESNTGSYGSPAALLKLTDGRLLLGYIRRIRERDGSQVIVRQSSDGGITWSKEHMVREKDGANWDVGYPRMVQRADGKIVIVYYWNHANRDDKYRYIAASIFDTEFLK